MWKSKSVVLYQNKSGDKYYFPSTASTDLHVLIFCYKELFSPDVRSRQDYDAAIKFLKLVRSVGIDCYHTPPARSFLLLAFFTRNEWDGDERALPWQNVVSRLRAYLSYDPAVGQVCLHILLRDLLTAAVYVYRRGRVVPKLRHPPSFRADARLPDYLHFPMYPFLPSNPCRSLNFAMHLYRQVLLFVDLVIPYYRLRRLALQLRQGGAPLRTRRIRRLRPIA